MIVHTCKYQTNIFNILKCVILVLIIAMCALQSLINVANSTRVIVAVFANFAIFATITCYFVIIVHTMVLLWYYVGCCRSVIIKQSMNNEFMILSLKETT